MSAAPSVFALIPAAGAGSRFGGTVRKAAVEILGRSIASWSIGAIDGVEGLVGGAVIVHESNLESAAHWIEDAGVRTSWQVVTGGGSRAESVARGVAVVPTDVELVLVHDAARPLVHRDDRDRVVEVAADFGAAILAHRIADTVKRVSDGDRIAETLDRRELWGAETPQVSRREWLVSAIESAQPGVGLTDESSWLEHSSLPVRVVESKHPNLKITQRDDLAIAAAVLSGRATS